MYDYRMARIGAILPALVVLFAGCGVSHRQAPVGTDETAISGDKVKVEAYLFDAQLRRDGKPTSFRLEMFQTDSLMGIGGRGYLGKGALKGWLSSDSLKVYFPSTDEYVYESVADLMASFDCTGRLPAINLFMLFSNLPETIQWDSSIAVVVNRDNPAQPTYGLSIRGCPWTIDITYDGQSTGWRVRSFEFTDGDKITLKATRREYRRTANVKAHKFQAPVGSASVRIIP